MEYRAEICLTLSVAYQSFHSNTNYFSFRDFSPIIKGLNVSTLVREEDTFRVNNKEFDRSFLTKKLNF